MINLSEERQAEIEIKQAGSLVSNPDIEESIPEPVIPLEADPSEQWLVAETGTYYNIWDYFPSLPSQLDYYIDGQNEYATYVNFFSEEYSVLQIQIRNQDNQVLTELYRIGDGKIEKLFSTNNVNPYDNLTTQWNELTLTNRRVLLHEPITRGTLWEDESGLKSEITQIYEEVLINNQNFYNVIEVTRMTTDGVTKDFYAPHQGFIGSWKSKALDEEGVWLRIRDSYQEVMITHPIRVYIPEQSDEGMVQAQEHSFSYMTNGSLSTSFQELFRNLQFIDETISVQSLYVDEQNVATLDFSPGVVAVLNQYPATEKAVIDSITYTVADFFDTDKVRLTVNQHLMLPNTFDMPEGGIYQVTLPNEVDQPDYQDN